MSLLGWRWYLFLAVGLLQTTLARYVGIPWLPADKVLVPSDWIEWAAWGLLTCFFGLSLLPLDRDGRSWVRFVTAFLEGLSSGCLVAYDSSTLQLRIVWAVALGVANALDRLAVFWTVQSMAETQEVLPTVGAVGHVEYKGDRHEIEVTSIRGDKATILYVNKPFWVNTETVSARDRRLRIHDGVSIGSSLLADHLVSGLRLRPLGFSFGSCLSQWMLCGFTREDSFVSGMLTGQALVATSLPLTVIILHALSNAFPNSLPLQCLIFALVISILCFVLVCFFPFVLMLFTFATVELWMHQVIVFLAVPVDACLFLFVVRPTADDIALYGLGTMLLNADSHLSTVRAYERLSSTAA